MISTTDVRGHFAQIWTGEAFAPTTITHRLKFGPRERERRRRGEMLHELGEVFGHAAASAIGRSFDGVVRRWHGVRDSGGTDAIVEPGLDSE